MIRLRCVVAWCAAGAVVAAAAMLAAQEPTAGTPPSWSVFRGNLGRTGELRTKGVGELHGVKWKFKVGDTPQDMAWSYPLVADGLVFMGSADNTRGTRKHLYAVDVATGVERWRFDAEGSVWSPLNAADGVLYFGDWRGWLYAIH